MPRVSEEYIKNKRREIVDAAFRVCTRKPINSIEMKDIIEETGFSHGVIYRYYKDLDEVLRDLVITINENNKIDDRLDEILENSGNDWEETIYAICDMQAEYMKEVGTDLLKVSIYSDMLALTDPERALRIARRLGKDEQSPLLYATVATEKFLEEVIVRNKLKPLSSVDEIIQFMIVAYHGIQTGYVLSDCYKAPHIVGKYKPEDMFRQLARSVILMLGGKADK